VRTAAAGATVGRVHREPVPAFADLATGYEVTVSFAAWALPCALERLPEPFRRELANALLDSDAHTTRARLDYGRALALYRVVERLLRELAPDARGARELALLSDSIRNQIAAEDAVTALGNPPVNPL
jgi:hypothetical protein